MCFYIVSMYYFAHNTLLNTKYTNFKMQCVQNPWIILKYILTKLCWWETWKHLNWNGSDAGFYESVKFIKNIICLNWFEGYSHALKQLMLKEFTSHTQAVAAPASKSQVTSILKCVSCQNQLDFINQYTHCYSQDADLIQWV